MELSKSIHLGRLCWPWNHQNLGLGNLKVKPGHVVSELPLLKRLLLQDMRFAELDLCVVGVAECAVASHHFELQYSQLSLLHVHFGVKGEIPSLTLLWLSEQWLMNSMWFLADFSKCGWRMEFQPLFLGKKKTTGLLHHTAFKINVLSWMPRKQREFLRTVCSLTQ